MSKTRYLLSALIFQLFAKYSSSDWFVLARKPAIHDPELGALTDDRLTRDVRLWQRLHGHRFSVDDVATAYVASRAMPEAKRVLDLGCGIGSVLLHLAWSLPNSFLTGVEAQAQSYTLLARNVQRNGYAERVTIHHADIRAEATLSAVGSGFDLVTGTPPYFKPSAALDAADEQRRFARVEYRGGVEDYIRVASRVASPSAKIVICGDARAEERVVDGASSNGVCIVARCDVIPFAGRASLFSIWTLSVSAEPFKASSLVIRDEAGLRTEDAARLRAFSGL